MSVSTVNEVLDDECEQDAPAVHCDRDSTDPYFCWRYVADRSIGAVLLTLTAPLTLTVYLLVRVTSPGPGFYRQCRVGLNGKTFDIIKMRTMYCDAEKHGQAVWCKKNDPRITRVGRILRKLHLDELPQLWNVMRGEMALIGPRPERPVICEDLAQQIDNYYLRNTIKPGITGLAAINLPPDETIDDVRRKQILDLRYIEEANLWLDTRIMIATGLRMFGVKGETVMKSMRLCRRDLVDHIGDSSDTCNCRSNEEHASLSPGWYNASDSDSGMACVTGSATAAPRHPR